MCRSQRAGSFLPVELMLGARDMEDSGENVEVTGAEKKNKNIGKIIESHPEGIRCRNC